MSGRPSVEVSIDELVLHGFDPHQRGAIGDAVRAAVAGALEGWRPEPGASATVASVDGGSFDVPAGAPAAAVGQGVARSVGAALRRGAAPGGTA